MTANDVPTAFGCDEAFRRLYDYLDRELDPAEVRLVEAHLAWCERCAREFDFEAGALREIRDRLRGAAVPEGLLDRVRALIAALPAGPTDNGTGPGRKTPGA